ncbi:beta-1,3-N-acetylglucosaminyltransferase radical fringe [Cladorrhinum sp. PSN259]|nr:beta-1,3-N-acetylglucosaminyltransferase radical fringe [Cladorrhinum sp. PSN259]
MRSPAARGLLVLRLDRRLARIAALISTVLLAIFLLTHLRQREPPAFYPFETTSAFYPVAFDGDLENKTIDEFCTSFPHHLTARIQPVLKMGHGENPKLVDAQLRTVSACFTNEELLIFSDLEQELHGRHVIDTLANLPQAYRNKDPNDGPNEDFDNYDKLQALAQAKKLNPGNDPAAGRNGWRLDKYKFLAEVERTWQMRPARDFYVFYESDTYISWDNMFRFLSTLDPNFPLYMGSPSPGRRDEKRKVNTWFANGGPGFVISRGAMEKLFERQSSADGHYTEAPFAIKWAELVRNDPCGDSVLGWALWNAGVPLSDQMWCHPFLTMHKLKVEDMVGLWRWENSNRKLGRPLLYSDIFEFLSPVEHGLRENWDNTNWDRVSPGRDTYVDTLDACKQACLDSDFCLSYHWQGNQAKKCVLMPFVTFGVEKAPETRQNKIRVGSKRQNHGGAHKQENGYKYVDETLNFTSGWLQSRIERWQRDHVCHSPEWVYPSIERHF